MGVQVSYPQPSSLAPSYKRITSGSEPEDRGAIPRGAANFGMLMSMKHIRLLSGKVRVQVPSIPPSPFLCSLKVRRLTVNQVYVGSTPTGGAIFWARYWVRQGESFSAPLDMGSIPIWSTTPNKHHPRAEVRMFLNGVCSLLPGLVQRDWMQEAAGVLYLCQISEMGSRLPD